jgi:hypothetical protein
MGSAPYNEPLVGLEAIARARRRQFRALFTDRYFARAARS